MVEFTQDDRYLNVSPPAGTGGMLLLTAFHGEEAISQPFRFTIDMIANEPAMDMTKMVGQSVSFSAKLPDDEQRYFHGKVLRMAAGEVATVDEGERIRYFRAEVVPNFWFLKFASDCRVFQDKAVPEIVEQVLKDRGLSGKDYSFNLKGTHAKRDYCVQYNETDYHFVTRLLEESGIYYYFSHDKHSHKMCIADNSAGYVDCTEAEVKFADRFSMQTAGRISKWEHQIEFTSGKYVQTDYNFETPDTNLLTSEKTIVKNPGGVKDFEVYEYPGGYLKTADGKPIATARIEDLETPHESITGESTCLSFSPGGKFKLTEHPVKAANKNFALASVQHEAYEPTLTFSEDENDKPPYQNSFHCVPSKVVYRPARQTPKPHVHGLQSAIVVGAKDKEIFSDKYGRIKIQFHWDREGKFDDKSSCWVRVAQSWAGSKRGTLFTPRVGDEVIVDFLDGDVDRPIVVGSLYNANNMPPYDPEYKGYQSGIKTFSTDKAKVKNFNELLFEDKIGNEQIYFHAERDFVRIVENDDKLKVGFETKDPGDQTIDIFNDRTITIDKGIDTLTVKTGDRVLNVDKGDHLVTIKQGDQTVKVTAGASSLEAGKEIVLKVGTNSIKIDQQGITIVGGNVSIEGKMKAELKGAMVDVAGSGMTTIKGALVKIN